MRQLERILVCLFAVLAVAGCSAHSNGDGGADVVVARDVAGADAARDAMDVQLADSGRMDTGTTTDSGADAVSSTDTGTDAVTSTDTGTDVSPVDNGTDAGQPDAGQPDVGIPDAATLPDAGGPPMCSGTMHVCICATGFYCLRIGFACLAPSSPCP